jgi:hypothetical protein
MRPIAAVLHEKAPRRSGARNIVGTDTAGGGAGNHAIAALRSRRWLVASTKSPACVVTRRIRYEIEPMTLGNMRELGVRSLDVSCGNCQHQAAPGASRRKRAARELAAALMRLRRDRNQNHRFLRVERPRRIDEAGGCF